MAGSEPLTAGTTPVCTWLGQSWGKFEGYSYSYSYYPYSYYYGAMASRSEPNSRGDCSSRLCAVG
jgi:hypothetical protein